MKKFLIYLIAFLMLFTTNLVIADAEEYKAVVYVSTNGNDSSDGLTPETAVKTIAKATEIMRTLKTKDETGVIYIDGGIYRSSEAVVLTEADSNLTIKNFENNPVEIYGSVSLSETDFTTVTDRNILSRIPKEAWGKVKYTDITDICSNLISYPDDSEPFEGTTGYYELYSGEKRQTLARWPNNTTDTVKAVENELVLTVENSERAKRWINAEKPILQGYLGAGYYYRCNVSSSYIYPETGKIKLSRYPYYQAQKDKEYFIYNLIEELDAPSEWFVEKRDGKTILYYYPSEAEELEFAINTNGGIIINGASNITIENIDFSYFAASAIYAEECDNITVKNCDITHMSRNAIEIKTSKNCTIEDCELANLGGSGILLSGGNSMTLEKGNNRVYNCKIHSAGYTYCAHNPSGVLVQGCGNIVENSDFFDLTNSALILEGSLHRISENDIHNVITIQNDAGAIYLGMGLLNFGSVIENNYIHDVGNGNSECIAIYIDDCSHGVTVSGNVIEKVGRGMLFGGGRNNTIKNNILINESIYYDVRGTTSGWAHAVWDVGGNYDRELAYLEENAEYDEEKIIAVYPGFKEIVKDIRKRRENSSYDSGIPKNVVIANNVHIKYDEKAESFLTPYELFGGLIKRFGNADESNNFSIRDYKAGFADYINKDYTIKDDSPILKALPKFERNEFSKIGAENGEYKTVLLPDKLSASAVISMGNIAEIKPSYGMKNVYTSEKIEITLSEAKESYELSIYAGNEKLEADSYTVTIDGLNMVIAFKEAMLPECIYQIELDGAFSYFETGSYLLNKVIEYNFDDKIPEVKSGYSPSGSYAKIVNDGISGSNVLEINFPNGEGKYAVNLASEALKYDHIILKYKLRIDGYGMYCRNVPQFTSSDEKSVANINSFAGYLTLKTAEGKLDMRPELEAYRKKYLNYQMEIDFKNGIVSTRKHLEDASQGTISGSFENINAKDLYSLTFIGESGLQCTVWIDDLVIECYSLTNQQ